ncbi:MAG: Transglycosylase-associated protein [Candidatus Moranbacteria bacterium GW2011_GWC2_37_73]|nr:MAG: Transglycosylase-associated protein [Parcubacteria group bacterium GW2011_GWC1_36_108]KKQ00696.1 MAG: Transglycosylase-associated protein [Candidatus Moranbacteria bacterium GW2011_GWD1_36_198]KKQ01485.1 MAG: Transglycosylase-associated protein [Candidatus Moranbacteria bacterium GW2011_GWD2_36_198]KKQ40417.1 MAG: Transglycosylase-associated protein [Candidatus Moranbacteria bacterium GW2011_GWC2_37_73]HAR99812.1 GlsB/YeaQ/YmgE family stress response membrane protein [Candidatus Moranba
MSILIWIIFGAIVGIIASAIMGTNERLLMDIILGIVGAVLGGWLMSFFGESGVSGFNLYSFFVAIFGAVVLIAIVRALK